jgi:hypothetical protein
LEEAGGPVSGPGFDEDVGLVVPDADLELTVEQSFEDVIPREPPRVENVNPIAAEDVVNRPGVTHELANLIADVVGRVEYGRNA